MAYDNNNSGALFKNDDKREGKKDPDYRGQAEVDGVLYWLDAWINESKKDGRKFMSVKFKPKEQRAGKPKPSEKPVEGFDDEIPF